MSLGQETAVFFFLLLLPTQLGRHFFPSFSYIQGVRVDYLSLIVYTTDLLAVVLALFFANTIIDWIKKNKYPLFLFSSLVILNAATAIHPLLSLYHGLKIFELVVVYVIFKNGKVNLRLFYLPLLLGASFELILSLWQLVSRSSIQGLFWFFGERYLTLGLANVAKAAFNGVEFLRPYGTFSHPNSLGGFYLLLYFFLMTKRTAEKKVFGLYFLLAVCSFLVLISFSKNAIITYCLLNGVNLVVSRKTNCKLCLISRATALTIVAFIFLQIQADPLSMTKRLMLLSHSVEIIRQHLLFGVGLGHYVIFEAQYPFASAFFSPQPVHNSLVLFLAEAGVFLSVFTILILAKIFKSAIVTSRSFFLCLLVILATGSFDHYWITSQQNWLLLAVVFGTIGRKGGDW